MNVKPASHCKCRVSQDPPGIQPYHGRKLPQALERHLPVDLWHVDVRDDEAISIRKIQNNPDKEIFIVVVVFAVRPNPDIVNDGLVASLGYMRVLYGMTGYDGTNAGGVARAGPFS